MKKLLMLCMVPITLFFGCLSAFATTEGVSSESVEPPPESYVRAKYADGIEPQEGDTFVVTYKLKDGDETAEITFDASTVAEEKKSLGLPKGIYRIVKIEYTGSNQQIIDDGSYGAEREFCALALKNSNDNVLQLDIGYERTHKLELASSDYIFISKDTDEYGAPVKEGEDEIVKEILEDAKTEDTPTTEVTEAYSEEYGDDYGASEQPTVEGQEPSTEYYTTEAESEDSSDEDTDSKLSSKTVTVILIIVVVVSFGIIIFLRKKGKLE